MSTLIEDTLYEPKIDKIIEQLAAKRLALLERDECPVCLLFEKCCVFEAMENEEGGDIYDALMPNGECKVKKRLENISDKDLGDFYLLRHWED